MSRFVHEYIHEPFPELEVQNNNGMRFYKAPNGLAYPSITTVLSKQPGKQQGLQEWRNRVGVEQAGIISGKAARRGSAFHWMCEDYLNNLDIGLEHKEKNFLAYHMFGEVKDHLVEHIDQVVLQEQSMYSDLFKVAGRCDFIGVYDNEMAVVDFKTTTTPKKREWIDDFFIQCSAYASMYAEHTKVSVDKLIVLMVSEDGQVDVYHEDTKDYLPKLEVLMEDFYENLNIEDLVA